MVVGPTARSTRQISGGSRNYRKGADHRRGVALERGVCKVVPSYGLQHFSTAATKWFDSKKFWNSTFSTWANYWMVQKCQILLNNAGYCRIILNVVEECWILSENVKSCRMMFNIVELCRILSKNVAFFLFWNVGALGKRVKIQKFATVKFFSPLRRTLVQTSSKMVSKWRKKCDVKVIVSKFWLKHCISDPFLKKNRLQNATPSFFGHFNWDFTQRYLSRMQKSWLELII